jgi:hypothetical protein
VQGHHRAGVPSEASLCDVASSLQGCGRRERLLPTPPKRLAPHNESKVDKIMKHTPGPWQVVAYYSSGERHTVAGPDGRDLCRFVHSQSGGWDLKEADARLIAAAPDMLEALKLAQRWLLNCMPVAELDGPKPLPVIAAALARAESSEDKTL